MHMQLHVGRQVLPCLGIICVVSFRLPLVCEKKQSASHDIRIYQIFDENYNLMLIRLDKLIKYNLMLFQLPDQSIEGFNFKFLDLMDLELECFRPF